MELYLIWCFDSSHDEGKYLIGVIPVAHTHILEELKDKTIGLQPINAGDYHDEGIYNAGNIEWIQNNL